MRTMFKVLKQRKFCEDLLRDGKVDFSLQLKRDQPATLLLRGDAPAEVIAQASKLFEVQILPA